MAVAEYAYTTQTPLEFKTSVTYSGGDIAYAVGIQSDGKIVMAGDGYGGLTLERLTTSGALDTSFGNPDDSYMPGVTSMIDFGMSTASWTTSMVIEGNDKILLAGSYYSFDNGNVDQFLVARFDADGDGLDHTFGAVSGSTKTGFQYASVGNSNDQGTGMAMEVDGSIVVAGYLSFHGFAFAQFSARET